MPCIFCNIVSGKIPAYKIWEDEDTLAFLDIHPINIGHTLVIPKYHESEFQNLDDVTYNKVMTTVKRVAKMIENGVQPKRVGLKVEGWDVPHAHVHVVPLFEISDITSKRAIEGTMLNPSPEELKEYQNKLTSQI